MKNYIVDDIGVVVTKMRTDKVLKAALIANLPALSHKGYDAAMPFYIFGHRQEIANRLLEMEKDKVFKYQKYPLVALRMDISERHADGVIEFNLNIAFIMLTEVKINAEERYTKVFKPILYPMYEAFFRQVKNAGLFMWEREQTRPEHQKFDRPYWGTEAKERNETNLFNDPLDAIEILDLKLKQVLKNC